MAIKRIGAQRTARFEIPDDLPDESKQCETTRTKAILATMAAWAGVMAGALWVVIRWRLYLAG